MFEAITPYCGSPPVPGLLAERWNLDPMLMAVLVASVLAYAIGAARAGLGRSERALFLVGWSIVGFSLVSPLCALSVALFSARVGQHMLITLVGAPLVVMGRPLVAARALIDGRGDTPWLRHPGALSSGVAFALMLWLWHMPGPYAATFRSDAIYWLMHLTLFGSALALWASLLAGGSESLASLLLGIGTSIQMGLLGAILTFAGRTRFGDHVLTAPNWGYTPLQDQQLGGILMWIPGCGIFVAAACLSLHRLIRTDPEPVLAKQGL